MKSATLMFAAFFWIIAATLHADESIAEKISTEDRAFFEKEVRPLVVKRCFECHGGSKAEGGLSLASAEGWKHGGDSGPAIVPGKADESFVVEAVKPQLLLCLPEATFHRPAAKSDSQDSTQRPSLAAGDPIGKKILYFAGQHILGNDQGALVANKFPCRRFPPTRVPSNLPNLGASRPSRV